MLINNIILIYLINTPDFVSVQNHSAQIVDFSSINHSFGPQYGMVIKHKNMGGYLKSFL